MATLEKEPARMSFVWAPVPQVARENSARAGLSRKTEMTLKVEAVALCVALIVLASIVGAVLGTLLGLVGQWLLVGT